MHFRSKGKKYRAPYRMYHYDPVTGHEVLVPEGYESDGATGFLVPDIWSQCWWVHDWLCDHGHWSDPDSAGKPVKCTNWDASRVLGDILRTEGHRCRCHTWRWATWLFGGGKCRENGMWRGKGKL